MNEKRAKLLKQLRQACEMPVQFASRATHIRQNRIRLIESGKAENSYRTEFECNILEGYYREWIRNTEALFGGAEPQPQPQPEREREAEPKLPPIPQGNGFVN